MPTRDDSGSDMDESSDIEDCIYGAISFAPVYQYTRSQQYSGDTYSEFSFSRDAVGQRQNKASENEYVEEEDSAGSTAEEGGNGSAGLRRQGHNRSETYSQVAVKKACHSNVPNGPPFHESHEEIGEATGELPSSKIRVIPCKVGLNSFSIKKDANSPAYAESNTRKEEHVRLNASTSARDKAVASSGSLPLRVPTFHASGQGPWYSVIAYDACVRLCLQSWARGCTEAPMFLENECAVLRNAFGLQHILLQPEDELLAKKSSEFVTQGAAPRPKRTIGKMKVQVCKVRMALDMPSGCNYLYLKPSMLKLETVRYRMSSLQSTLSSGWGSLQQVRFLPHLPANSSFSQYSLAYVHASARYIKEISGLLKTGVTVLRNNSYEAVQESYCCLLRLRSSAEGDAVRMLPGSGETHVFFPDSLGDDLIVEVYDSKGKLYGSVAAQVVNIAEHQSNKVRWWSIYHEPEHELVGWLQLYMNYSTSSDENNSLKCGSVAETVAYDLVLEVALKVQHFRQRNLLLHGAWKWLLTEFASYYGVSEAYTKLRYLSYVMDVATPTVDCLMLVHDLLLPVILKSHNKNVLSHQENRVLGEIKEQIQLILETAFENYKSLDESTPLGIVEVFSSATGSSAPALIHAVKLYGLLHDILSPEAQVKLCSYFQSAAKKRSRRHLLETDEFVAGSPECTLMDALTLSTAYQKMKTLCLNIKHEIFKDIEIHDQHMLPSFVDLPNLSASIYSVDLCIRLREFLVAYPAAGPSPHVTELLIATSDFQRDLTTWNICPVKGGVDAKELFHRNIILWIQDKRLSLLESCKSEKVKWSGIGTQELTTPFVDDMYDHLKDTLNEYDVIICRWPEYTVVLENAIADIEKAVIEAMERHYADVLTPLKDSLLPKKFGLKYVQKLTNLHSICPYIVPDELGTLLNTMKRLLEVLHPKIEMQFRSWGSCIPDGGGTMIAERLIEVTVTLRAKFRNYVQAVVEKLVENTRAQSATKLKKIIQDSKDVVVESDIRNRMQPLKDQLLQTIYHLHNVFEGHVFVAICRGYWDRMGQDMLNFLESRKENRSWYKGARITVSILDDTFVSQMQQLLGNAVQVKDLEPPRSVMEVRSMLCNDAANHKDSSFYY